MSALELTTVHVYRDYAGELSVVQKFFEGSWQSICDMVNESENAYTDQREDFFLRVFCPYSGEELYVPK